MNILLIRMILSGGAFFLLAWGARIAHAADCQEILTENRYYECEVKGENGSVHSDCFWFGNPTATGFRLVERNVGFQLACSCRTAKSFDNPAFDDGKEFLCVSTNAPTGSHEAYTGKAVGKKIKKGEIVTATGFSWAFECEQAPSSCFP